MIPAAARWFRTSSLVLLVACNGGDDEGDKTKTTDTGVEGDADTDTDADADTATDTDTTDTATTPTDTALPPGIPRFMPTTGQGVALSSDGTVAVVANRTSNEITVIDLDLTVNPTVGTTKVTYGEGDGEPWAAVFDQTDEHVFVVERKAKQVLRIDDPKGAASKFATTAATDSEPTGIAISPNGRAVYVPNWGAGTVTVIDAGTMATHTVDLNQALIDAGVLGDSVTTSRPGLARPYAIAVTDDGDADDNDETVFVTEFFAQDDPSATFDGDDAYFDTNKQGLVYWFDVATETVGAPVTLGASDDMGFTDSNGVTAGCFPNQLYAVARDGERLYVSGLCASPRGPAAPGAVDKVSNFKTKVETVLYVVDTTAKTELVGERLHTNQLWQAEYDATGIPDDASRRFPLITNALAFVPGTHILYLSAYGADAMFRIEFDGATHELFQVGSGFNDFVDLAASTPAGKLPYGIAIFPGTALLVNENTRNLSVVDLGTQSVETVLPCATPVNGADPDAVELNDGRRLFVTGTGRWSYNAQGWGSCEGCHPGGLTDNVTWFFAAGPRQTVSMDSSFSSRGDQRIFNWTAIFDEVADFEGNVRGISGGVGALVYDNVAPLVNDDRIVFDGTGITGNQIATDTLQAGLNGSTFEIVDPGVPGNSLTNADLTAQSVLTDWNKIDAWLRTLRSPAAPNLDQAKVDAGQALFEEQKCTGCHAGRNWTISERFYTPSQATNDAVSGTLSTDTYDRGNLPPGLNPPADAGGGSAVLRAGGSIQCVLRGVGTFPPTGTEGVAPDGVVVSERKDDMVTTAAGINGFNPPSLLGVGAGAPYFHAGNARTLEEVLDITFVSHYRAFSANFTPSVTDIENLTAFLLSIDDASDTLGVDAGTIDAEICD
ncbi:MAG: hypothetical protein ABMB14_05750 [Myxococcota bacterium]